MSPPSRRPVSRRATLAAVGASIAGLGGCAGTDLDRGSPAPSRSATSTDARTATRTPATVGTTAPPAELTITPIDPPETPAPAYPADYRSLLARAARDGGGRLRGVASTLAYSPAPTCRACRGSTSPATTASAGRYDVACEGGTYYAWLVGVEEATGEGRAEGEATPVDDLPPERARFVRRVANDSRYVEPQTERGEWVRETFVGGRFALDGTTYRGVELQQTDAAFFGTRAWFALGLLPVGGDGDEGGRPDRRRRRRRRRRGRRR
jgi:hypothetical protein